MYRLLWFVAALLSTTLPGHAAPVFEEASLSDAALQQHRAGRVGRLGGLSLSEPYVLGQFRMTADLRAIAFDTWFFEEGATLLAGAATMPTPG